MSPSNPGNQAAELRCPRLRRRVPAACLLSRGLSVLFFVLLLASASVRAQPRLSSSSAEAARAGQPFRLEVEVRWTGEPGRYVLYPPKIALPLPVHMTAQRQYFEARGGETVYHYEYTLIADEPGEQQLGPISLEYRDMQAEGGTTPEPIREEGPVVRVHPGGVRGWIGRLLVGVAAATALLALVRWRMRRPRSAAATVPAAQESSPEELLDLARGHLLEGRSDEVYATLLRLKPLLRSGEDPLPSTEQLEAERLRARYGGVSSAREELERLVRAVDRTLSSRKA